MSQDNPQDPTPESTEDVIGRTEDAIRRFKEVIDVLQGALDLDGEIKKIHGRLTELNDAVKTVQPSGIEGEGRSVGDQITSDHPMHHFVQALNDIKRFACTPPSDNDEAALRDWQKHLIERINLDLTLTADECSEAYIASVSEWAVGPAFKIRYGEALVPAAEQILGCKDLKEVMERFPSLSSELTDHLAHRRGLQTGWRLLRSFFQSSPQITQKRLAQIHGLTETKVSRDLFEASRYFEKWVVLNYLREAYGRDSEVSTSRRFGTGSLRIGADNLLLGSSVEQFIEGPTSESKVSSKHRYHYTVIDKTKDEEFEQQYSSSKLSFGELLLSGDVAMQLLRRTSLFVHVISNGANPRLLEKILDDDIRAYSIIADQQASNLAEYLKDFSLKDNNLDKDPRRQLRKLVTPRGAWPLTFTAAGFLIPSMFGPDVVFLDPKLSYPETPPVPVRQRGQEPLLQHWFMDPGNHLRDIDDVKRSYAELVWSKVESRGL